MTLIIGPDLPDTAPAAETREVTVGMSQGRLIMQRFLHNGVAIASFIVFAFIVILSVTSVGAFGIPGWWKWQYTDLVPLLNGGAPTLSIIPEWLGGDGIHLGEHPFGQTLIGIDYFAMTMRGVQNSLIVMFIIGFLVAVIGTVVGAVAGYYRGNDWRFGNSFVRRGLRAAEILVD
jgi:ABC-type dipeptide/oligopeptide/nickel transport systems, permease components